jgi:hypothetical protein
MVAGDVLIEDRSVWLETSDSVIFGYQARPGVIRLWAEKRLWHSFGAQSARRHTPTSSVRILRRDRRDHQFHIGAKGEASEDPQPGEYQEDMYGNPVLSPEERAEAEEAEEEKRQQEECANRREHP